MREDAERGERGEDSSTVEIKHVLARVGQQALVWTERSRKL